MLKKQKNKQCLDHKIHLEAQENRINFYTCTLFKSLLLCRRLSAEVFCFYNLYEIRFVNLYLKLSTIKIHFLAFSRALYCLLVYEEYIRVNDVPVIMININV